MILTVQALCVCCGFSACTSADARVAAEAPAPMDAAVAAENYSLWLREYYSSDVASRAEWLAQLIGLCGRQASSDAVGLFFTAYELGLTDSPLPRPYAALTRAYAAETLYRAMGYTPHMADGLADVDAQDEAMMTLVYYGWFLPDAEGRVYPDAAVSLTEFSALCEELQRCAALRGKRLLAFGDSIMYGAGNNGEGAADLFADKYGMIAADYSVSGATLGVCSGRGHIADQIRSAALNRERADLILINGGTNDILHTQLGAFTDSTVPTAFDERTCLGGTDVCFSLIRQCWTEVPVLYIRAHNMSAYDDARERQYGEAILTVAEKWRVACADAFSDTGFNTEAESVCDRYTYYSSKTQRHDSIHPTWLGYAKYYLPLICETAEIRES